MASKPAYAARTIVAAAPAALSPCLAGAAVAGVALLAGKFEGMLLG